MSGEEGVWVAFDVDDRAWVSLVTLDDDMTVILGSRSPAEKVAFAVGDGSYRVQLPADEVLLASTSEPLAELDALVAGVAGAEAPLSALAAAIRQADPRADVRRGP